MLYHLLPVAFWLLAAGLCCLPFIFAAILNSPSHIFSFPFVSYFAPAVLTLFCLLIIIRIPRRADAVEPCFRVGLLLGIASYWLPSVLLLIVPVWIYLTYRNVIYSFRLVIASLIGIALVAIWAAVCIFMGWLDCPWADFWNTKNLWAWLPTGSFIFAFIGSTIVRQNLRAR